MMNVSPTLNEVLRSNYGPMLFPDLPYVDYDHVKKVITDEYLEREIAYDNVGLFVHKFNHDLELFVGNYNKMRRSEMIELDPFVTDYMEETGFDAEERNRHNKLNRGQVESENTDTVSYGKTGHSETYTNTQETTHAKDNIDTMVNGKLASEAENTSRDENANLTESTTSDRTYHETTDTTTKQETHSTDTIDTTSDTHRTYQESGSQKGHNLVVGSDTPQAMLFNEPNHYYGTGRADDYGKVVTDSEGKQSYEHYPETNPDMIDEGSYTIGSGDTPWFNYASNANNNTGHSSYQKSGTEDTNTTSHSSDVFEGTQDTTGNAEVDGTDNTEGTKKQDQTKAELGSRALNRNEHQKQDETHSEAYKENTSNTYTNTTDINNDTSGNVKRGKDTQFSEAGNEKNHAKKEYSHTRKGRVMSNPSKLLQDFRNTMTFNADMWLIGEMSHLFLEIY